MEKLFLFIKRGIVIPFLIGACNLYAQMTLNPQANALLMAGTIQGSGVTITNPVKTAPISQTATFDNGNKTNIGLTKGIILSTGASTAINGAGTSSANTNNNAPGYALLDPLAGAPTHDAAILEFDVVPTCDYMQVRFVFATEEYPDFVGTPYNDAFGFFLSGPNPDGGNYTNSNFALVPGTNTPISVNTVNNGYGNTGPCMNCSYYIDNSVGPSIKYNGFTTPMTSKVKVSPGKSYHLILAIADGNDGNEDAAVLIDFGGLDCPTSLPVEFESFTGEKTNNGNLLKWTTASEINNKFFIVERSTDGKQFEEVGKVNSANNGKGKNNYEFTDHHRLSPVMYPNIFYRLKQEDIDGKDSYAGKIIQIDNIYNGSKLVVNPILPENNILDVTYVSSGDDQVEMYLMDASGKIVFKENISCHSGANEMTINMSQFTTGMYFIKLISTEEILGSKVIKN